jgi:anaerobic selenocysteine-containing dehydrogenase
MKGRDRCALLLHPRDASAAGLVDGNMAEVRTTEGTVTVPVEVSDEMMPGVASLPHGWGHDRPGTRIAVAESRPGVNNNVLNPATFYDVPSGTLAVNGVPCTIAPV